MSSVLCVGIKDIIISSSVPASDKVRGNDWQLSARQFDAESSQMMPILCCRLVLMSR